MQLYCNIKNICHEKNIKKFSLNKKTVSNLSSSIKGGRAVIGHPESDFGGTICWSYNICDNSVNGCHSIDCETLPECYSTLCPSVGC